MEGKEKKEASFRKVLLILQELSEWEFTNDEASFGVKSTKIKILRF